MNSTAEYLDSRVRNASFTSLSLRPAKIILAAPSFARASIVAFPIQVLPPVATIILPYSCGSGGSLELLIFFDNGQRMK
jgi:hypothetical protein